jgi:hypothetical protein
VKGFVFGFSFASSAAAFFFCLDTKETKHQGLDLMSAILVETFIAATQVFRRRVGTERVALCLIIES